MARIIQNQAAQPKNSQIKEMPVGDSSFIQNIKYDPASLQLTVTMKSGAEYIHWHVYPAVADDFMQSASKGQFYSEAIKGKHPSTRVVNKNIGRQTKNTSRA